MGEVVAAVTNGRLGGSTELFGTWQQLRFRPVKVVRSDWQGSIHKMSLCRSTSWASGFGNALRLKGGVELR
jgi:hypothetical protein